MCVCVCVCVCVCGMPSVHPVGLQSLELCLHGQLVPGGASALSGSWVGVVRCIHLAELCSSPNWFLSWPSGHLNAAVVGDHPSHGAR